MQRVPKTLLTGEAEARVGFKQGVSPSMSDLTASANYRRSHSSFKQGVSPSMSDPSGRCLRALFRAQVSNRA